MVDGIRKFFHHLFNPHCRECEEIKEEERRYEAEANHCESCENLKLQLRITNDQNSLLVQSITEMMKPVVKENKPQETPVVLHGKKPWPVKQRELEMQDRALAIEQAKHKNIQREADKLNGVQPVAEVSLENLEEVIEAEANAK